MPRRPKSSCTGCTGPGRDGGGLAPGASCRRGVVPRHRLAPARPSAVSDRGDARTARQGGAPRRRRGGGIPWARVQAQTRVPDHPVLLAAARGEPSSGPRRRGGHPPGLRAPPVRRAGPGLRDARSGVRRRHGPRARGRGRIDLRGGSRRRSASCYAPRPMARCATSSTGYPDPRGEASGSRWTRPTYEHAPARAGRDPEESR